MKRIPVALQREHQSSVIEARNTVEDRERRYDLLSKCHRVLAIRRLAVIADRNPTTSADMTAQVIVIIGLEMSAMTGILTEEITRWIVPAIGQLHQFNATMRTVPHHSNHKFKSRPDKTRKTM
jgi:hypothetical protein